MSSVSDNASAKGAEGASGSTSAADLSNVEINEATTVPEVEVKHAPFQSQPSLRGELTEEQLKELGDKMRKEQAKKYFSLRVRELIFFILGRFLMLRTQFFDSANVTET